jgi:hypothetical protein
MAKSRPTTRSRINVEPLEARLALSAAGGVAPMLASEVSTLTANKAVTGTLRGTVANEGGHFYVFNGISGKVGKTQFAGGGLAQGSGSQITGGEFHLGNAEGILNLSLESGRLKAASKKTRSTKVVFIVDIATGKYAGLEGWSGKLTLVVPDVSGTSTHASLSVVSTTGAGEILSN